ncbi:MAG: GIY-YIG nuclease family protein [Hyphomicrobiales bacterium]|nr:GIY-YIG nuclease family protein [Hyphomicrobiales bacterium]
MPLQVVYVLTNPAMPGFVKIGKTLLEDVGQRLAQLYTTGVPFPFELAFACKVPNADEVEKALHRAFAPNRANPKREFFNIEADQAIAILKLLHVEDATAEIAAMPTIIAQDEVEAATTYKKRRPPLNFTEMGIAKGSVLHMVGSTATVTVCADRKVLFEGEEMSLTAVTMKLMGLDYAIQPTPHWTFEGRSLTEIYNEIYNSN